MEKETTKMIHQIFGVSENSSREELIEAYRKAKKIFSEKNPKFVKGFNNEEIIKLNQFIEKTFISLSSDLDFKESNKKLEGKTRFSHYSINPEMEERILKTENFDGSFLREIRVYKNISLNQIHELTKIKMSHLINIENNQFSHLPREVFVRSYVKKYAEILNLDCDRVIMSFMNYYRSYIENQT